MSNQPKPGAWSIVMDWTFWLWLIAALIVYFALRASGVSGVGAFLIALAVEVAGQIALRAFARAAGGRGDRKRGPRRRTNDP